ncbi:porin [Aquimarina gracilis]|uniref:Porin n=2 Tax=Aquimarina gracilis TaxID=874422 RepID=A0ABU5ZSI3_9FLAO|nr:porin [Aquimarina gracilis]MEB3345029.1 porin [Aquimarina gracilis]
MSLSLHLNAQKIKQEKTKSFPNKPLKWYLNKDQNHWIGIHTYAQLSGRVNQNNPGSLVNNQLEKTTTDISIRRFRLGIKSQVSDHLFIYTQFGTNNLNYLSSKGPSIKLLDAYAEYNFSEEFSIGAGKSLWNGLSRFSAPSTSKLMVVDVPFIALPTVNTTDDLLRNLSIFTKGKFHKFDYRFLVSKPFPIQANSSIPADPKEGIAEFTSSPSKIQYAGYIKYEFLGSESNKYASHSGTYLGAKKILSLGTGFKFQSDALCSLEQGIESFHDMTLLAADIFVELPINKSKGSTFTSYLGFFKYDFGPNYLRSIGANNPTNGLDSENASFNGKGNAYPVLGTGTSFLYQFGYLFPKMGKNNTKGQLQPYGRVQYSDFDRLSDPMIAFDLGVNWFLNNHKSKLTLNAQNRPIFYNQEDNLEEDNRKWMFVLQYQFKIQ